MLGDILTRTYCNHRRWLLRCPDCGNEWVSDVHRDEYYGWEPKEAECSECGATGEVTDTEVGRDEAADAAYDRWVEERTEKLMERREIDVF